MGVGDVISQQLIERRGLANHNVRRTAKMMSIGFFFVVSTLLMTFAVLLKKIIFTASLGTNMPSFIFVQTEMQNKEL